MDQHGNNLTPDELFMMSLVEEDVCPKCLGELDTGWECNDCGYDARWLICSDAAYQEQSNALHLY